MTARIHPLEARQAVEQVGDSNARQYEENQQ